MLHSHFVTKMWDIFYFVFILFLETKKKQCQAVKGQNTKPTGSDYLDKDGVDSDEDTDDDKCFDEDMDSSLYEPEEELDSQSDIELPQEEEADVR